MPSINAYFLGNDVCLIENYAGLGRQGDLMNRLIHRSWGEGFVNFFLDLFVNISCAPHEPEGGIGTPRVSAGLFARSWRGLDW